MFGNRKTLSLWRQRVPNFLEMERALASPQRGGRLTEVEHAVIALKAARRRLEEAKRKFRPTA